MKEEKACANCGAMYHVEQLFRFDDALLCRDCLHMETVECAHCGTRVWNNDNYGDEGMPLCEHCYNIQTGLNSIKESLNEELLTSVIPI